ncbi:MAG: hypothetical protein AAGM84_11925 [Pseudomonadota bacterium]
MAAYACQGTPISFSNGVNGCVTRLESTDITQGNFVIGGGPAARRSSKSQIAVAVVEIGGSKQASVGKRARRSMGREVCTALRERVKALDLPWNNIFLGALLVWRDDMVSFNTLANVKTIEDMRRIPRDQWRYQRVTRPRHDEFHLTRGCLVRKQK